MISKSNNKSMRKLLRLSVLLAAILLLIACEKVKNPGEIEYEVNHWPDVKTLEITGITDTSATLTAAVNAFNLPTIVTFEYGNTTSYGNTVKADQSPVTGYGITNVSANISGLLPYTPYHFRVKAENSIWKNFYGSDKTFILPVLPDSLAKRLPVIQDTHVIIEYLDEVCVKYTISDNGGGEIISIGICLDSCRFPYHGKRNMVMDWSYSPPYDKDQSHNLKPLTPGTTYYVRAWARNNFGEGYGEEVMFTTPPLVATGDVFNPDLHYGSVTDIDGNVYGTIQIGTQIWMAENLKTTRYNNGSQISVIIAANPDGVALSTAAYYWYNDDSRYKNSFGALYNHYAVNAGNLCPTGWHVPDDEEWKKLEMTLGMTQTEADDCGNFDSSSGHYIIRYRGTDQGTQMKAANGWRGWFDWNLWDMRNGNGTNTSGFSALPAGDVGWWNGFSYQGSGRTTSWWCSGSPIARTLLNEISGVGSGHLPEYLGISIRCLKD